jgi:hypothetical protein
MSTTDAKVLAEWIRMVHEEAAKPLTDWELSFMESITDQFERTGRLSERQVEILERIYADKTD